VGTGMVLKQVVTQPPIDGRWWKNGEPWTLLGNSQNWTDITVSAKALVLTRAAATAQPAHTASVWSTPSSRNPAATARGGHGAHAHARANGPAASFVRVCARISTFQPNGEPPQGYCLIVDGTGAWFLTKGGSGPNPQHRDVPVVLASGPLVGSAIGDAHGPAPGSANVVGTWHTLRLTVHGTTVSGLVDGKQVGSVRDSTFTHGMVAVGSGWHEACFDDFVVTATTA
jgi:hypothetical protein